MKPISASHASINKAWVNKALGQPGGNYPCARKLRLMAPGLAVEALVAIS